jgi:hypothetical protein
MFFTSKYETISPLTIILQLLKKRKEGIYLASGKLLGDSRREK